VAELLERQRPVQRSGPNESHGPELLEYGHTANRCLPPQNWVGRGFVDLAMANYTTMAVIKRCVVGARALPLAPEMSRRAPATPRHLLSAMNPATWTAIC